MWPQKTTTQLDVQSVQRAMELQHVALYLPPELSPSSVDRFSPQYCLLIGT